MADICILGVVISKLIYWWEPGPIILLKVDKSLEIGFYDIVLPFDLPVNL